MNWTIEYIRSLIDNKVEENLNLDYKAAASLERNDKKTIEISKDISAFANSDGGTIIYGITEDSDLKHLPAEIDPVDREIITKEWLEQIIQGKIRPRIDGISIIPIEIDNNPKKVIYVVEIPKSNTAHQADDRKYYKRFNFNSVPMFDYEIRDILNRSKNPEIDLEFGITRHTYEITNGFDLPFQSFAQDINGRLINVKPEKKYQTDYTLRVYAKNNGKVLANYINAYIGLRDDYLLDNNNPYSEIIQLFADNTIRDVIDSTSMPTMNGRMRSIPKYGPSRYDPILPRQKMKIKSKGINEKAILSDDEIIWIVYADNAEPRKGRIKFKDITMTMKE